MIKKIIGSILMAFCTVTGHAQHVKFVTSGMISYEKKANVQAIFKKQKIADPNASAIIEHYLKNHPQFKTLNSTLKFSEDKTLYLPEQMTADISLPAFDQNSTVYTDLKTKACISQKQIFEKSFLIKDKLREIRWKITAETRDIAGYECIRANAVIMDSVYVVAFYTDKIITPGGPESFSGLPGMILGVALPHEHVTWFATKVTDTTLPATEISPPTKGMEVTYQKFATDLQEYLKRYQTLLQQALKFYLL